MLRGAKPRIRVRGEAGRAEARGSKARQRGGILGDGKASLLPTSWGVWGSAVYDTYKTVEATRPRHG